MNDTILYEGLAANVSCAEEASCGAVGIGFEGCLAMCELMKFGCFRKNMS